MLEPHPGSFYCFVPKSPSFFGGLLGQNTKSEQIVKDRLDLVYKRYSQGSNLHGDVLPASSASPERAAVQQAQKFVYPGGGITVQPGVHKITDTLVQVTPYVHHARDSIVVFFGSLSNLQDLASRRHEFGSAHHQFDLGPGAMTTSILLDMYKHFADGRELLLLSELQGHFSFVLYDSSKKQALAARDPSGAEPLFYRIDDDGAVHFTNSLEQLPPGDAERGPWRALPPGHMIVGRTVTQFALSLEQLEKRERKESQDADSFQLMRRESERERDRDRDDEERDTSSKAFSAVRSLMRNRSK